MPLEPGLWADVDLVVTDADTAIAFGSGNVAVLATPRVVALVEEASIKAIDGRLPDGYTSVGMRVQLDHLQPNAVGSKVTGEATLERVEGKRLTFTVAVNDSRGLVAAGRVTRIVVEIEPFLHKA